MCDAARMIERDDRFGGEVPLAMGFGDAEDRLGLAAGKAAGPQRRLVGRTEEAREIAAFGFGRCFDTRLDAARGLGRKLLTDDQAGEKGGDAERALLAVRKPYRTHRRDVARQRRRNRSCGRHEPAVQLRAHACLKAG